METETNTMLGMKFISRDRQFEIRLATKDDTEEILEHQCNAFFERDPVVVHLKISKDKLPYLFRPMIERSIEENLNVVCVDVETGKIAATATCFDLYNYVTKPFSPPPSSDKNINDYRELFDSMEDSDGLNIEKFGDAIYFDTITSSSSYQGYGIVKKTAEWLFNCHPVVSYCSQLRGLITNPISRIIVTKLLDLKIRKTVCLKEYKNSQGEAIFKDIKESKVNKKNEIYSVSAAGCRFLRPRL